LKRVAHVLIVDDEPSICWGLSRLARGLGHDVEVAASAEQGLALAQRRPPDVLLLDVRLPGQDGLSAMDSFRRFLGAGPIIVMTAFGDLATAMSALDNGAFEYVVKPFDLAEIRAALERALRGERADAPLEPPQSVEGMLGATPVMQAVFKRIALAAKSEAAVLLHGESGVGKELAASAIHRHSAAREGAFVAVNVAALSPTLAEAELFGHVAGAFTGAAQARRGLLAEADGGTLFLDEVADIPLPVQVKLLRALDQGEVLPVGADRPVRTRFRLISATHRDLRQQVRAQHFRHDLYFRLCTFEITLPPLRQRRADIPLLARHFAAQLAGRATDLADETLAVLSQQPWYGNVRELKNAVEHALVVARTGAVLPGHLPPPLPRLDDAGADDGAPGPDLAGAVDKLARSLLADPAAAGGVYDRFLEEVEPPLLAAAMDSSGHRCAPAARALGLHRTTLKRKLDQYGIDEAAAQG
jgi:two-component system nitrogen regulation response regulator GlnG